MTLYRRKSCCERFVRSAGLRAVTNLEPRRLCSNYCLSGRNGRNCAKLTKTMLLLGALSEDGSFWLYKHVMSCHIFAVANIVPFDGGER